VIAISVSRCIGCTPAFSSTAKWHVFFLGLAFSQLAYQLVSE